MDDSRSENKSFTVTDRRFWVNDDGTSETGESDDGNEVREDKPTYVRQLEEALEKKDQKLREIAADYEKSLEQLSQARERMKRDIGREMEQKSKAVIVEFLDVLDNLERALASAAETEAQSPVVQGVSMVRDLFAAKLANLGVLPIVALNSRFNPAEHEALSTVPASDGATDGTVVAVLREGYTINGEVLRPAGVVVARSS